MRLNPHQTHTLDAPFDEAVLRNETVGVWIDFCGILGAQDAMYPY